ncbi:MAG: outer membrane lipoprotein carrier protein LolA [Acidobacteriota bacterium]|nr:outer membrane lipoprotein carrier protein LolA [Acidobacteriota bacterium]
MKWFCLCLITLTAFANEPANKQRKRKVEVDPKLAALVEKVDAKAEEINTMRADFRQRKEIYMLKEPVEMKGVFSIRRPDGMRFDFEEKEDLILIMTREDMVSLSHKAKKASSIKLKKRHGRFVQRLLSDKLGSLTKYFDMTLEEDDKGYRLLLMPAKRKLKKRFKSIHTAVNKEYLITYIKVELTDGDIYELYLDNIQLNQELPGDIFNTVIPEGYQMGERMDSIFGAGEKF